MTGTAIARAGALSYLKLIEIELRHSIRNEILRTTVSIDFPEEKTPRKWAVGLLQCFVRSGPMSTNGYVAVPESHPWYKVHCFECPIKCGERWCDHTPEAVIAVHGGLTYSALAVEGWVFGFDTAHYNDYVPYLRIHGLDEDELNVWDTESLAQEVNKMAEQLERVRRLLPA